MTHIEVIKLGDRTEIVILLDFYGNLLSEKQLEAMQAYYFNDLSLNEIAYNQNISKQGVSNLLKRAEGKLYEIESELKLINKSKLAKKKLSLLIEYIEKNNISFSEENISHIHRELINLLDEI